MDSSHPARELLPPAVFVLLGLYALLRFNSNLVLSGDALSTYLPGAIALGRFDLEGFRAAMAHGVEGRPPLFSILIAVPQIVMPPAEAAHLVVAASGVGAALLAYRLLSFRLPPAAAAGGALLWMTSPAVLPYTANTTPDTLFVCVMLGMFWAHLEKRTALVLLLFVLAVFCRANGYFLVALVAIHLFERRRDGRVPYAGAAVVALTFALRLLYLRWVQPDAVGITEIYAHNWHESIFLTQGSGTFGERFQPFAVEQWWRMFVRMFVTAPIDLVLHFGSDLGIHHYVGGVIFTVAAAATMLAPKRFIVAGLMFYMPLAVFHWETRYMMAVYAALLLAGLAQGSKLFARPAVTRGFLGVAAIEAIVSLVGFDGLYPHSSGTEHHVDVQGREVFTLMRAETEHRPIRVFGCLTLPFMLFNHVRYAEFEDVECRDSRHQDPRAWSDLDFAVLDRKLSWIDNEPYNHFRARGRLLKTLGDRYDIYGNRDSNLELRKELPVQIEKDARTDVGWGAVVYTTQELKAGETILTRFDAWSDGSVKNLRFGYQLDGEIYERGVLKFRNIPVRRAERSIALRCEKPTCKMAFIVQTQDTGNAEHRMILQGLTTLTASTAEER